MTTRFEQRLQDGPIVVGDGGMGVLVTSAVPRLRCPEEANLRAPESVVTLHTSFIRAGADLIETNTFGANRRKLSQLYLDDEFERINSAGVKLAREAREVNGFAVALDPSLTAAAPAGEAGGPLLTLSPARNKIIGLRSRMRCGAGTPRGATAACDIPRRMGEG